MKTDVIPPIAVVEWKYRGLFGYVKTVWVLPSVKVQVPSRVDVRREQIFPKDVSDE